MHSGQVDRLVYQLNSSLAVEKQALHHELNELGAQEMQLRDEQLLLNREIYDLDVAQKELDEERARFEEEVAAEWDDGKAMDETRRIRLNVGGQVFEVSAPLLCKDRFSLLAALCSKKSAIKPDAKGMYFVDRDWWIFRHVLAFLRDGALPKSTDLLRELYVESAYYRLGSLRAAIERKFVRRQFGTGKGLTREDMAKRDGLIKEAAIMHHVLDGGNRMRTPLQTIRAASDALHWADYSHGLPAARGDDVNGMALGLDAAMGMGMGMGYGQQAQAAQVMFPYGQVGAAGRTSQRYRRDSYSDYNQVPQFYSTGYGGLYDDYGIDGVLDYQGGSEAVDGFEAAMGYPFGRGGAAGGMRARRPRQYAQPLSDPFGFAPGGGTGAGYGAGAQYGGGGGGYGNSFARFGAPAWQPRLATKPLPDPYGFTRRNGGM